MTCDHTKREYKPAWDHVPCTICGMVRPGITELRRVGLHRLPDTDPRVWFPSMQAFAVFERTGQRPWEKDEGK